MRRSAILLGLVLVAGTGCAAPTTDPAPTATTGPVATGTRAGDQAAPDATAARPLTDQESFVPERLRLPSGRTARVQPAGIGPDGTLAIPADPARIGWWDGGSRPGDPFGTVVVAGHIDSRRYGIGVLAEVAEARPGQEVRLSAGSRSLRYRIVSVRQVPKARLATGTDTFDLAGAARLALITCGGRFDARTHSYADNVVVLATPVG